MCQTFYVLIVNSPTLESLGNITKGNSCTHIKDFNI